MKLTLLTPYRPNLSGYGNQYMMMQDSDGFWHEGDLNTKINDNFNRQDVIVRGLEALRKNSKYKHKSIIVHEPDVIFNEDYKNKLKEKYDVEFFKSRQKQPIFHSMREALLSLSSDSIVCYNYNIDLICCKNWDKFIKEARDSYGPDKVYTPIWVEPRQRLTHANIGHCGPEYKNESYTEDTTMDSIWNVWRKFNCHSLTMKFPIDKDYITEKELDEWSDACNQFDKKVIIEQCGKRDYGYYNAMIANAPIFQQIADALMCTDCAPDLRFDDSLKRDKAVITNSHLFHIHFRVELDNIEVEHET